VALTLLKCGGGQLTLPDAASLLLDRLDGGNLVVLPPRDVWERGELQANELTAFGFQVAAAAHAMLAALPQLADGCLNYWEAGNWALNEAAEPVGPKQPRHHRHMHLHLLGRSPSGQRWGESPRFPDFAERDTAATSFARLTPAECYAVVTGTQARLISYYGVSPGDIAPWTTCRQCKYPTPDVVDGLCRECQP